MDAGTKEEKKIAVTNFDGWNYDVQIADLYQFMRKILEKHDWDFEIGKNMLNKYQEVKALSKRGAGKFKYSVCIS